MKLRRVLAGSVFVLIVALTIGWIYLGRIIFALMHPNGAFDPTRLPPAPDYASPAMWSALPDREDAADAPIPSSPGLAVAPATDQRGATADVFYVHPTSYVGGRWNGPVDDAKLNEATDRVATRLQASAFNGCCAIFAPRYRQANGMAFTHPSKDGEQALDLAYSDVASAFRVFLQHSAARGVGRPIIVAGHSQGSMLAYRLIKEEITGKPLRERLVAAYLLGGGLTSDRLAAELPDVPLCASPTQIGCLIAFNARGPHYVPGDFEMHLPGEAGEDRRARMRRLACVNPLTGASGAGVAPSLVHKGALFLESASPRVLPGFARAACEDGLLVVSDPGPIPRDLMSRLLDRVLGAGNYHAVEYQLFFLNLRADAATRLAAYQESQPRLQR